MHLQQAFLMALPCENLTAEAREKEQAARRLWLRELPRLTGEKRFLAESAAAWSQARELGEEDLQKSLLAAASGSGQRQDRL